MSTDSNHFFFIVTIRNDQRTYLAEIFFLPNTRTVPNGAGTLFANFYSGV